MQNRGHLKIFLDRMQVHHQEQSHVVRQSYWMREDVESEDESHAVVLRDSVNEDDEDYDRLPLIQPAPKTLSAFIYHIVLVPFLTGIAQGLGTSFATYLLTKVRTWRIPEVKISPGKLVSRGTPTS